MKMTYTVNVSEEKRLCPLDARLNPEWRCKEWDELKTECCTFYGYDETTLAQNTNGEVH